MGGKIQRRAEGVLIWTDKSGLRLNRKHFILMDWRNLCTDGANSVKRLK